MMEKEIMNLFLILLMTFNNLKIKKKLNEPLYTIGGETISSRVLKHWHDKGI